MKARFDEEQNLLWASSSNARRVQVIYGFVDWKTHAKVSMVVRREGDGYRTYCHFGTGNYHPVTARTYTDLSFFTARSQSGARRGSALFNFLHAMSKPQADGAAGHLSIGMREKLYGCIDREIVNARGASAAAIWAKLNA